MVHEVSRVEAVRSLLNPASVAIIGANDRPDAWPERIRQNLLRFGFEGEIFPVNPKRDQLWGGPCYPSAGDLPTPADHLIVLVPAAFAVEAVRQGAKAGSRSATVFSGGLDEAQLEELRDLAQEYGVAISGPNCLGNISSAVPLVTTTDSRLDKIKVGPVAVVGQSGGIVTALHRSLADRGIGAKYMVSSGNETVLTTADYLNYFAMDDDIRVVVAFVESIREREAFFSACDDLHRRGKRVVALKVGRSPESQAAAASHTGALAGSLEAFEAVGARHGIITVPTLELATEVCEMLSRVPVPTGGEVAVVTVSGGVRELALDGAHLHGVKLAQPTAAVEARLTEIIGAEMDPTNPLDTGYAGLSDPRNLVACVEAMASLPSVGLVLLQEELLGRPAHHKEETLDLFNESFPEGCVNGTGTPVALFSMTTTNVTDFGREIRDRNGNLAFVQGIDNALAVAGSLVASAARADRPDLQPERAAKAKELLAGLPASLSEADAKRLAALYGVSSPDEGEVRTPAEVEEWAESHVPGPFVVKVVAAGLRHKTEGGGVQLGLATPGEAKAAAERILAAYGEIDGFIVARQAAVGTELIVGFQNDREVGPVVAVGLGGTSVELYADVKLLPVPCSPAEAEAGLRATAAGRVLDGFRGAQPGDMAAAAEAVAAVAAMAAELSDEVDSFEINPLRVLERGQGALALDALCLRPTPEHR